MQRYFISRVIQSLLVLAGVLMMVFFMMHLTGDPAGLMASRNASPEEIARLRDQMGLNRPMTIQFFEFAIDVLSGDFGNSTRYHQPAMDLILERLPATVELASISLFISMIIGIPLGLLGGSNPNSMVDYLARGAGLFGQTVPNFWLALILILVFGLHLGWFPTFGRETWRFMGLTLPTRSVFLPACSLSLFTLGQLARFTRSAVMEVRSEDYILTARSKGLSVRRIYIQHILRNASIPLISIVGVQFGYLLSGSIYIETIFSWPGLGNLLADAIGNRDFALVQGIAFFSSFVVVVLNLLTDMAYATADPRVRYGE